jgi:hypothetical protein
MIAKSAANKPRIKQSFFGTWIERACHSDIAGGIANSRRKACGSQRLEAFLGFEKCLCIIGVEVMPSIAGVIHHDLGCHLMLLFPVPKFISNGGRKCCAPQLVAACRYWPTMRILPTWEPGRAITFMGARSVSAAGTRGRANQLAEAEGIVAASLCVLRLGGIDERDLATLSQ